MAYAYFSRDGKILPVGQAVVPLEDIHYAYGFGVYETVRVSGGKPRFIGEHCRRLAGSAKIIGLQHTFSTDFIDKSIQDVISRNKVENCNIKILLRGGTTPERAGLDILCLNPRYPDRKLYKHGARVITAGLERPFPRAKTLNMLPSYLAHRDARAAGAYDALLIDRHGHITEATTANVFAVKDRTIFSPPEADILPGVTRGHVLETARANGFAIEEKALRPADLAGYDDLFLTSTSAKIMPVRSVDDLDLGPPGEALRELMRQFDNFLR